jgi:hypothetical protein
LLSVNSIEKIEEHSIEPRIGGCLDVEVLEVVNIQTKIFASNGCSVLLLLVAAGDLGGVMDVLHYS